MNKKVLITGISGFLGSQIAETLKNQGYIICGIKRPNSNLWRCESFLEQITWISIEDSNWKRLIIDFKPDIFVHTAWEGVWSDRDNYHIQLKNIDFTLNILELAKTVNAQKFIAFGSQAEYGLFSGIISEDYPTNPTSAYGLCKNLVAQTIKCYCEQNDINWYWLRLFSFFGEKEDNQWFIPMVIEAILNGKPLDMSPGLQQYAYMYVNDLALIIERIAAISIKAGIYNLSSKQPKSLREIVENIVGAINPVDIQINWGAIPYRENQPMLIQGETKKLENQIGELLETDFDYNLKKVINYIKNNLK
jgi:nucleoside-diphosphate-sugar epimerase